MKFYYYLFTILLLIIININLYSQERITPKCYKITNEANQLPDQSSRLIWAFDNNISECYISGETDQKFTCFGIGVSPSIDINPLQISIEYKIGNENWKKTDIEYIPEEIVRDNLFWTNLNFSKNADAVSKFEIKILVPASVAIDSVKMHIINIDFNNIPKTADNSNPSKSGSCPAYPTVIPRSTWLDPYYIQPAYTPAVITPHHIVLHHGASPDSYTNGDAVVRSYWNYHVNSLGWSDIGYNYLTDKDGNIYKGRMNSDPQNQDCRGAHAGASNNESIGICFIGNSIVLAPSSVQNEATCNLMAWWFNERGYDPTASESITLQSGGSSSIPRICGHKDVNIGGTTCPGTGVYNNMANYRTDTKAIIDACVSYYTYGTSYGDYIDGVVLDGEDAADISNTSTGTEGGPSYNDYSASHSADLIAEHSYTLSLTNGDYGDETLAAWIDYDDDGIFEPSEKLGEVIDVIATGNTSINFTVPAGTPTGTISMRIRAVWSDINIDANSIYSFGETEDYEIRIISPCTTPGTPINLTTSAIDDDEATFSWSAGSPAGTPTIAYYWAVGLDGSNPTYSANYIDHGYTNSTSVTTSVALDPDTDYEWSVKAHTPCDATQSTYASYKDFTTSCVTPGTPQSLSESDITNTGVTLNWTANATTPGSPTVTYYWAVNTTTTVNYETNYVQRGYTTDLNNDVYSLTPGTTYYWTVKAVTSCGVSSSSSYASYDSFVTSAIPVTLTWTGATSTEWNLESNWNPNQIPTISDDVLIPDVSAASNRFPITQYDISINNTSLGASRKCKSLTILANASVTCNNTTGNQLYIEGEMDISGTLNYQCGATSNEFRINSGGTVSIKDGGVLNIGSSSFSGTPSGTIDEFNDIYLNGGVLNIEPGGKVFIMDNLQITGTSGNNGTLNMEGGELWIKYYGNGSTSSDGFDIDQYATVNVTGGDIKICGADNYANADPHILEWNSSANVSITGGTIILLNEQSDGTLNYDGKMNFGGHAINNLTINRPSKTNYLNTNNLTINGNLTITAGTFDANTLNITLNGDFTNNGTFTPNSATVTLKGNNKKINGSSQTGFYNLTLADNSSYTIDHTHTNTWIPVTNTFTLNSACTLNINSGKQLSLSGDATFNGTINAIDVYDETVDIGLNGTKNICGNGNINADLRTTTNTRTLTSDLSVNGDFLIESGANFTMTSHSLTTDGDWINNGTFTCGTGTIKLTGNGKNILGSSESDINHLKIIDGASYTLNPSSTNGDIDIIGQFEMESGSSLTIASGKYLDLYSSTADSESVILNGDITAVSAFDGTRDIDLNNTVELSGSGDINADLRIFDNITTLVSDFVIDGDFETYNNLGEFQGSFVMTNQKLTINGDFTNNYRFIPGTGTVIFSGSNDQLVDCGCSNSDCNADTEDTDYRRLNNVIVECNGSASVKTTEHMRVEGDFTVNSGTFTTGDALGGKKINIYGISTIENGAYFNVGNSVYNSGDVADFHNNLIVRGQVTSNRSILDGYAEVRTYASRLFAEGDTDEVNADVQVYLNDATQQLSDLYISGDLIVQSTNEFKCTDHNLTLTIGGDLFIYHNFTHYGTVNLYGDFRENTPIGEDAEICDIASSTFNMYGNNKINFNPSSGFGNLNIMSGTRSINESGGQTPYSELDIKGNLTIKDGATLDAGTDNKNIDIEGDWNVEGTGIFVPGNEKVTFSGTNLDQYIYVNTTSNCEFYQLDVNKTLGNVILQSNVDVNYRIDLYSSGISLDGNTLYLRGSSNTINSFMDGVSYSGYIISETEDNTSIFKRNFGISTEKWFPFSNFSGESLAMIIKNNNGGIDNLGDVSIATYPTIENNNPLPSSVDHLTTDVLTTDTYNQMVDRFWQIDASGTVNDVDITFTYIDDSWDAFTMTAQRWDGSDWESAPATSTHNNINNTVTVKNVTGFYPWALVKKDWQLPIELISFDAQKYKDIVNVVWQTANEYNNDYFEVEKSTNLINIETIAKVQGAGFSNTIIDYLVTDKNPYSGVSYYRLKQVDFDGTRSYSDWVAVEFKDINELENTNNKLVIEPEIEILSAYPNPTNDVVKILYNSSCNQEVQYSIFDYTGRLLDNGTHNSIKGENEIDLNFQTYENSVYIVIIKASKSTDQIKIIKN